MAERRAEIRMQYNDEDEARNRRPAANVAPRVALEQNRNHPHCDDSGQRRASDKFAEFVLLLRRDDGIPKNILLLGERSSGKSSLLNLLTTAVLEGVYKEMATPGQLLDGDEGSFSAHLQFFRNMGLSEKEMVAFRAKHHLRNDFQLPTIIDMPGLEQDEKVVEHVLRGEVPPDTELKSCMTISRQLQLKLRTENSEERRIDRVIFVHALPRDVNQPLLKKVLDVLRGVDGRSRCIPYFLVVTHIDEAGERGVPRSREQKEKVNALCNMLGLRNNRTKRYAEVANYVDAREDIAAAAGTFETDWNKQIAGLKILYQVCQRREIQQPMPFDDCWQTILKKDLTKAAKFVSKVMIFNTVVGLCWGVIRVVLRMRHRH